MPLAIPGGQLTMASGGTLSGAASHDYIIYLTSTGDAVTTNHRIAL